jgi:hypothetical protein
MADNDFLPVTDDKPKKSVKKQIIWTVVITLVLGFIAYLGLINTTEHNRVYDKEYLAHHANNNLRIIFREITTNSTRIMLITVCFTFFLTLGMLLLKSIEWKEPEKCEKTLHYFYLAILVLSIVGIFTGIAGLTSNGYFY